MDQKFDLKFVIQEKKPREYEAGNQPPGFDSASSAESNSLSSVLGKDNPLNIDGKKYYPAGVLAKEFDYAVDYVSWLARTGKAEGIRKGKRWVLTRESVQAHKNFAQSNKQQGGWKSLPAGRQAKNKVLSPVLSFASVKRVLIEKADKVRAASSFILAGGLLLFLFFNFGIFKIDFNFNKEPVARSYKNIQAKVFGPLQSHSRFVGTQTASLWSKLADWILNEPSPSYVTVEEYEVLRLRIKNLSEVSFDSSEDPRSSPTSSERIIVQKETIITRKPATSPESTVLSSINERIDNITVLLETTKMNLSNLGGDFVAFQNRFPTGFSIGSFQPTPSNNASGTIGGVTIFGAKELNSEKLNVTGNTILTVLDVSGNTTLSTFTASSGTVTGAFTVDGGLTVGSNISASGLTLSGNLTGINAEFQGTASASYLLTGNTLQVGGFSSAAYSRFGTATATQTAFITTTNDLLISGDLEVDGKVFFDGTASVASNFEVGGIASISGAITQNIVTASNSFQGSLDVTKGLAFFGEIRPDGLDCTNGQILKKTGANDWDCAADAGGSVSSNSLDFDEFVDTMLLDANLTINRGAGFKIGLGAAPSTVFEVQGTASASYLLTGNTLQVGGFSSAAYSRFGTDTTGYSTELDTTNDLLISGALEVNGNVFLDGKASISNNFQTAGRFIFGDNGDTGEINTSDWDISTTGALTGFSFDANGTGNSITNIDNADITADNLDFTAISDTPTLDANLAITRGGFYIGLGAAPSTVFEVQGTASASYLLTGNTLQVGGFSSAAYSRFGTATAGSPDISTSNDLLISGDLEIDGKVSASG
ncbi:MAG: hypothetical protein Q8R34_01995, partial [bacterium]|nr:hypothetical protein [bacterium]